MKTILLAISGSIAFYKAYELISLFKKEGFKVKVLLSNGVLKFASKLSFEALADAVLCEENESWKNEFNHIKFSKDVDVVLFAPASVNSINKLALGICDNLFVQTLIATKAKLIIAPAANTAMYEHFSTQNSLKTLAKTATIISPIKKTLACKDEGLGALAELSDIFNITKKELLKTKFWQDKKVVITGGASSEKIDDVRCVSNFSSGKMAKCIADAFYFSGARVIFLSSNEYKMPYEIYKFQSSSELKKLLNEHLDGEFLIMCAAVSDFVPEYKKGKIKKSENLKSLNLSLKPNEDLLKNIKFKGKKIGFKMEFDKENALQNAQNALLEKGLDMICLNVLGKENSFGSEKNELSFITKQNLVKSGLKSKEKLGFELVKMCEML